MTYLTCTTITSINIAHYGVSRAKDWVSVDCGTIMNIYNSNKAFYLNLETEEWKASFWTIYFGVSLRNMHHICANQSWAVLSA